EALARAVATLYPLIAIVLVIALLGVVNSLFTSVIDRTREIGLLRAVGTTRRQVMRLVVIEGGIIGLTGGLFGVVGGSMLGYLLVRPLLPSVFGITGLLRSPSALAGFALFASTLLAGAAALLPGRRAARLKPVVALERE